MLEKDRILQGVTGKTTAKVTSQHRVVYKTCVDRFGEEKASLHGEAGQSAMEIVRRLAAETGADAKIVNAPNCVWTRGRWTGCARRQR